MMPPTFNIVCVAIYVGLTLLIGYAILCWVSDGKSDHLAQVVARSFALGAAGISFILFYFSLAGLRPVKAILAVVAFLALLMLGTLWRHKKMVGPNVPSPWRRPDAISLLGGCALAVIIFTSLNVCFAASWPGLNDNDVFGIWLFKAKWVSLAALRPLPPAFVDPTLSYSHQDYPLSMPFYVAGLYSMVGAVDETSVKLLCCPIYLSVAGLVYAALRNFHRRGLSLAITAVFCSAPTLCHNASLLVGETFLIMGLTGTVTSLLRWSQLREKKDLVLCGLFAAAAAFSKNEGLALLPVIGSTTFFLALRMKEIKTWTRSFLPAAMIITPWLIFRIFLPKTHEDYGGKLLRPAEFLQHTDRLAYLFREFSYRLFDAPRQGLIWYLLIISVVVGSRAFSRIGVIALWAILIIQFGMYLATFIVTPWSVSELLPMIGPKLLTQISPIAALLVGAHLQDVRWTRSDKSLLPIATS